LSREHPDRLTVTLSEGFNRFGTGGMAVVRFQAGENDARGHALHIPFPRTGDGFIEVVDVENETAVGRFVAAQILDVRIAAELHEDTCMRLIGEIGSHDGDGTAEESKRRFRHPAVFERQKLWYASLRRSQENIDWIKAALMSAELAELRAANSFSLLAAHLLTHAVLFYRIFFPLAHARGSVSGHRFTSDRDAGFHSGFVHAPWLRFAKVEDRDAIPISIIGLGNSVIGN
jgi:hypothetical protein